MRRQRESTSSVPKYRWKGYDKLKHLTRMLGHGMFCGNQLIRLVEPNQDTSFRVQLAQPRGWFRSELSIY